MFTTIQKYFPEVKGDTHPTLSERRNIVLIAEMARRSQYEVIDGYARQMPEALHNFLFIGFTGMHGIGQRVGRAVCTAVVETPTTLSPWPLSC